jgi:MYXO-CTERM domain-containing protein
MSIANILLNIVGVIVVLVLFVLGYALITEHPSLLGVLAAIALLAFLFLRIRRRRGA